MKTRTSDIVLFAVWPVIAAGISLLLNADAFWSPIIFYGPPIILLSFRCRRFVSRAALVSLLILPAMVIADYVAEASKTWLWPLPASIFPFRLFGYVSIEVLIWVYLHLFVVILFYEYFFDHHKRIGKIKNPRLGLCLKAIVAIFIVFILLYAFSPGYLMLPHWYLIFGSLLILPSVLLEAFRYPRVLGKIVKTAAYFFYLNLVYELTALKIGWWSFPGHQFIGQVSILGITFPFEEFLFWIVLFTAALLSNYEYFVDDEK